MPLPGYSAPPPTDTTLIVGVSIFLSFFIFTFIACFCCQGCPLNRFYIRKRVNEGNVRCPSCRQQGHIPMVLSNENGLVATCASHGCQPMLLGPSGSGFVTPYPMCDTNNLGWSRSRPQTQHQSEINVIYPSYDPPPYRESYTDPGSKLKSRSERCVPLLRGCYEDEARGGASQTAADKSTGNNLINSTISMIAERGQHALAEVLQNRSTSTGPWRKEEMPEWQHMLSDRSRDRSLEKERTLDRTTVV